MLLRRKNKNIFMSRSCGNGKPGICDKGVRLFPFWKFILGDKCVIIRVSSSSAMISLYSSCYDFMINTSLFLTL